MDISRHIHHTQQQSGDRPRRQLGMQYLLPPSAGPLGGRIRRNRSRTRVGDSSKITLMAVHWARYLR